MASDPGVNPQQISGTTNKQIKKISDLLKKGEENIKFDLHKNAVLVLGNTGSGITTFTQYIAGNNNDLISEAVGYDTGEFKIVDNNKISNNSTTIFPELAFDIKRNTAFYDFPGFSDTRSTAHDIAATYFTKKVIDSTSNIKIVFLVSYPSVRQGVDSQQFILSVKHATSTIKNIDKFKDSIALVVTNVDNQYIRKGKELLLLSDEKIIQNIAKFLDEVKQDLKRRIEHDDALSHDQQFYKNAIEFIDILIVQDGHSYNKIGIFRRPDEPGVLSKIKLLQDGKKSLENIIHRNIQFITHEQGDLGYSISADSNNHVQRLAEEISDSITSNIKNIGREIKAYYDAQETQSQDLHKLYDKFKSGYEGMLESKKTIIEFGEPLKFIKEIIKNMNNLNVNIPSKHLLILLNYDRNLKFLQMVSSDQSKYYNSLEWVEGLTDITEYLNHSSKWYAFLMNLYSILSKYNIQKNIRKFDISNLKRQIEDSENKAVRIDDIDLQQFLNHINNQEYYNDIKDIPVDKFKLKALGKVLDLTLNYKVEAMCMRSQKLMIKGQYVKLSDIIRLSCPKRIKFINIFALNTVFIDANINKTGARISLSIIAPTWEIIGSRKIILDGKPGKAQAKARNAIIPGNKGIDGKPGLPGGSAGHFLGIGETFINGEHLTISAIGGKGGPGQNGGDGAAGRDGQVPPIPSSYNDGVWQRQGFSVIINNEHKQINWFSEYFVKKCTVTQNGQDGGSGGNGGVGGKGGLSGDIIIINLQDSEIVTTKQSLYEDVSSQPHLRISDDEDYEGDCGSGYEDNEDIIRATGYVKRCLVFESSGDGGNVGHGDAGREDAHTRDIVFINAVGARGDSGFGGLGGMGGKDGYILRIELYDRDPNHHTYYKVLSWSKRETSANSGYYGTYGYNDKYMKEPKVVKYFYPSHAINSYKNYARENLNSGIMEFSLRRFLNRLENNMHVTGLYDTLGFVNELQGLENQFYELHENILFRPFYKYLLHRIANYAEDPKSYETDKEYKKVLSYLYTATLSKICSMNNNLENNLIVNLNGYLGLAIENINKLKDLSNVVEINKYKTNYQNAINAKTNEAEDFINSQITPELNHIFGQIDNQIMVLIDEVITLQNASNKEKIKLMDRQQQLQDSLVLKKRLEIIKIAIKFLGVLGPFGTLIGAYVGITMVPNSLALDDEGIQGTEGTLALPNAINNSVTDQLKYRQQLFKHKIQYAEQKLADFVVKEPDGNIVRTIRNKISDTRTRLDNEMAKEAVLDLDIFYNMQKELKELLQNEKETLEKQNPKTDKGIGSQLGIVTHIQNALRTDYFTEIRNHQAKIDEAGDAIARVDDKITELEQYENNIYKTIIPLFQNMENNTMKMQNELQGKSHVALDISKWKIQSTIRDVKLQMQQMTKDFKIQEDLRRCIEKLEEGMSIMINVYDRIEEYRDRAELAAYISDISSSKAMGLKISNTELQNAINDLNVVIKSNLVLGQYESAMNAFKQYIFPFAHSYLEQFSLPSPIRFGNNTNSLVSDAVEEINYLKSEIIKSTVLINKYDEYIFSNIEFNSNQTSPFFVWQNDINKATISKLLEGKEITIKADIMKGIDENAIKFNVIEIHFKLPNETIQAKLDKELQNFEVTMTHLGNSYYRCSNKFYIITSDKQTIRYSLKKGNNGEPIKKNLVYDKLKNNDLILSPYAMWNIKLNNAYNNFSILNKYKNQAVDLELVGRGQYIDQDIDVCNENLENYYKVDDTISEINNINIYEYNQQNLQEILSEIDVNVGDSALSRFRRHNNHKADLIMKHGYSFATSGTSSNIKSSFINKIFNLIGNHLIAFKSLIPVNKITQWLSNNHGNSDDQEILDNTSSDMKMINIQPLFAESGKILNGFLDQDSSVNEKINYTLINMQGNLLLLDLLIRKQNGVNYNNYKSFVNDNIDNEYAHSLAYNAYAP